MEVWVGGMEVWVGGMEVWVGGMEVWVAWFGKVISPIYTAADNSFLNPHLLKYFT